MTYCGLFGSATRAVTEYPLSTMAAVLVAAATVACDSETTSTTPTVSLVSVASVPAPFSMASQPLLVDQDLICLPASFEMQVRCVDRNGDLVATFGREGEGPGEFKLPPRLLRGPNGTVGAISFNRLTIFTRGGDLVDHIILPINFPQPAAKAFDTTLLAHSPEGTFPIEIDLSSGALLWERHDIPDIVQTECGRVGAGVVSPTGGWAHTACQRELVFLDDRDASTATVIQAPTYAEELPNERDIADFENRARSVAFRMDVDAYRETPKRNHLRGGRSLAYDAQGRLWLATQRDRAQFSYLDLYVGTEYVGSVQVRDRLLGYDLYGSTLAVLVERAPDAAGIAWRALDWYDIAEVDLGLGRP